jgi:hypothetical protein
MVGTTIVATRTVGGFGGREGSDYLSPPLVVIAYVSARHAMNFSAMRKNSDSPVT